MLRSRFLPPLSTLAAFILLPTLAHASRTGLNNIPIADVSSAGAGVVQSYSAFGPTRDTSILSGVRFGLALGGERFEAGVDSRWEPAPSVPLYFNFKWASTWKKSAPALGIGVANVAPRAGDRTVLGQPQWYAVLSHDLGVARLHAGYAVQRRNNAAFFGLDRSWQVEGHKLTFRTDVIEIQDRRQWLGSAGFTFKFTPELTLELWESKPTQTGRAYTTAKLGWQFLPRPHAKR